MGSDPGQELVQVVPVELPVEGPCRRVVARLERTQALGNNGEVEKVVGGNDFSLHHGEIYFPYLVQPRGMDGQVDQAERGPFALQAVCLLYTSRCV